MNTEELIPIATLCSHYSVELSFFSSLREFGLVEITTVRESHYVHPDQIVSIEKMVRIHHDLEVNMEGIDVVFNLLKKIEDLKQELGLVKSRLHRYED